MRALGIKKMKYKDIKNKFPFNLQFDRVALC
jgi:hypothetical protein